MFLSSTDIPHRHRLCITQILSSSQCNHKMLSRMIPMDRLKSMRHSRRLLRILSLINHLLTRQPRRRFNRLPYRLKLVTPTLLEFHPLLKVHRRSSINMPKLSIINLCFLPPVLRNHLFTSNRIHNFKFNRCLKAQSAQLAHNKGHISNQQTPTKPSFNLKYLPRISHNHLLCTRNRPIVLTKSPF
jgi:hypothetical protein